MGMEIFTAQKIAELESISDRPCRVCGESLKLVSAVFYPERDAVVRSFECKCGERIWDDQ